MQTLGGNVNVIYSPVIQQEIASSKASFDVTDCFYLPRMLCAICWNIGFNVPTSVGSQKYIWRYNNMLDNRLKTNLILFSNIGYSTVYCVNTVLGVNRMRYCKRLKHGQHKYSHNSREMSHVFSPYTFQCRSLIDTTPIM